MNSDANAKVTSLKKRPLGKTGLLVSTLCYGCASAFGRDLISDDRAIALVRRAVELGVNFFDTGRSYGKAEERLGAALKAIPGLKREDLVVASKFDLAELNPFDVSKLDRDWATRSVETSLKTLGLDYLDVLFVHEPNPDALNDDQLFSFLDDLKRQGLVRASGVNTYDSALASRAAREKRFDVVMLDHNVATRRGTILAELAGAGIGVVAGQALAQGLFTKKLFRIREKKDLWYLLRAFGKKQSRELYKRAKKLRFLNRLDGITAAQAAIAYAVGSAGVAAASFNSCDLNRLEECVLGAGLRLPDEILRRIENA